MIAMLIQVAKSVTWSERNIIFRLNRIISQRKNKGTDDISSIPKKDLENEIDTVLIPICRVG